MSAVKHSAVDEKKAGLLRGFTSAWLREGFAIPTLRLAMTNHLLLRV
ncbi:MAG: hypothetical protein ACRCYY_11955 [Trueperaceae bacterium]